MDKAPYRLGIDMGTNSLGWCLVRLDEKEKPCGILDAGARIFSDGRDPQTGTSLAVGRRMARSARRRRDRFLYRKSKLMRLLLRLGLMPQNKNERKKLEILNPYQLRAEALDRALSPYELGRALYHLNQRRGFLSNRKTATKEEGKKIKPDIEGLQEAIIESGAKTLGQYLWQRVQKGELARARTGEKLYPTRALYKEEFNLICERQAGHHKLSEADWEAIGERIFYQRDLKPVTPGRCQLYPEERRARSALPSFQKFRIAQDITNLAWIDDKGKSHFLDEGQRKKLWDLLHKQKTMKFESVRKKLELPEGVTFNLEDEKRKDLKGNVTAIFLSDKKYFGKKWFEVSDEDRDRIVEELMDIEEEESVVRKAIDEWGLNEEQAKKLAELLPEDFMPGYCRFGITVLQKLVPLMRDKGMRYDEAVKAIGLHHSDKRPAGDSRELEYYAKFMPEAAFIEGKPDAPEDLPEQKYGKIGNPTVHVALNQLRLVVNEILKVHGRPAEIVVELARDLKQSQKQREETQKEQARNQRNNERIAGEMEKLGVTNNGLNRAKFKLWEELNYGDINDRCCPFSGEKISIDALFSKKVEIEHILPLSKSLDDSLSNKTLSMSHANRLKGNRAPYDAFGRPDGAQARRDLLLEEEPGDLTLGRFHLFSENHHEGRTGLHGARALDAVVVGGGDAGEIWAPP
ncbi:MAG: type II CRISPR RNA-guided endonuclease Cas9 [Nitrospinae bacterium]|nr:type II CRISPR RNA-guided endonuclease Cas9 [Nitrospinota bacterium]